MRFLITKTSSKSNSVVYPPKPCEEAFHTPKGWMITLDSIFDLTSFIIKHGRVTIDIVNVPNDKDVLDEEFMIELCDDYRESIEND